MAKLVAVPSTEQFDSKLADALEQLSNESDTLYAFFFSDWCPDCHQADPLVREYFGKENGKIVLDCNVGTRDPYKRSDFPYRQHPQIKLTAIPTVIRWGKDGPKERLVEEECYDTAKLARFFGH